VVILDDTLGYPLLNHNGNGNDEVPEACDWYVSPHIHCISHCVQCEHIDSVQRIRL
jgi:hypothetical protein